MPNIATKALGPAQAFAGEGIEPFNQRPLGQTWQDVAQQAGGFHHFGHADAHAGIDVACLGPTDLSGSAGVLRQFGGKGFGAFKGELADLLVVKLAPIAEETRRLLADPGYVDGVLRDGARRAAAIADPIVDEAERLVGFLKV